jgi:hypothetical protein
MFPIHPNVSAYTHNFNNGSGDSPEEAAEIQPLCLRCLLRCLRWWGAIGAIGGMANEGPITVRFE